MQIRLHVNGHNWLNKFAPRDPEGHCGGGGGVRGHIFNCGKTVTNTCIIMLQLSLAKPGNSASTMYNSEHVTWKLRNTEITKYREAKNEVAGCYTNEYELDGCLERRRTTMPTPLGYHNVMLPAIALVGLCMPPNITDTLPAIATRKMYEM